MIYVTCVCDLLCDVCGMCRVRRHSGGLKTGGGPDLSGVHEEGAYDARLTTAAPILRASTPQVAAGWLVGWLVGW